MDTYQITITRESHFSCCAKVYDVEVDGLFVGKLKNGGFVSTHTSEGVHTVSFLGFGRVQKNLSVTLGPECPTVEITANHNNWGKLVLTTSKYWPGGAGASIGTTPAIKKKHTGLKVFGAVACILLAIGIIGSALDTTPDDSLDGSSNAASQNIDKGEQTAQNLLDSARENFEDGMYSSAFSKCDKVKSDYPDTAAAASVDAFLNGLYDAAINITAVDIHSAYDANEVNADNTYKDKAIVVTGTVSDIGKNVLNQTYITLKDGSDYGLTSIQCFFDREQEDDVGNISKGSSVKLIGKCVGENLMNVQINGCYLIG